MGYRGKLEERARARELRAQAWTMPEIAEHLGVSRSSVSLWTRDVPFDPSARRSARTDRRPRGSDHPMRRRKLAEIAHYDAAGRRDLAELTDRELLIAGLGLYAGDGSKRDGEVRFANSDASLIEFFCRWLRTCFTVDEDRLRVRLYLHEGLDLAVAQRFWSDRTGIDKTRFTKAYRAVPDATIRHNKHRHGCAHVSYASSAVHRQIMGLIRALYGYGLEPWNDEERPPSGDRS
ncbi:MAG: helix-turn-helix domain-containing protein [Nitriliruptor sp.]|uniref:helix-turn-helix domain-containing protein n=1 Tax=Nitriliruptor sp. TaxID=2448056 RepID=UPI0034A081D4